ncbi:hypothetical protein [Streptomyces sp. KL116D]|uniref:hypothetical protein n=1 Tax=Streptomyces sp. KL116D TaxID=3045152 RepID=UPI0035563B5E
MLALGGGIGRFCMSALLTLPDDIDRAGLLGTLRRPRPARRAALPALTGRSPPCGSTPAGGVDVEALLREVPYGGADVQAELDAAAGPPSTRTRASWRSSSASPRTRPPTPPPAPTGCRSSCTTSLVDGASWRILLPDLAAAWQRVRDGLAPHRPAPAPRCAGGRTPSPTRRPPRSGRRNCPAGRRSCARTNPRWAHGRWTRHATSPPPWTPSASRSRPTSPRTLLDTLPALFHGGVDDGLLAGLASGTGPPPRPRAPPAPAALVRLEGHGREEHLVPGADPVGHARLVHRHVPRTPRPAGIDVDDAFAGGAAAGQAVKAVKEQLRSVPDNGMGYGLLRHSTRGPQPPLAGLRQPQIGFNYLGRSSRADLPEGTARPQLDPGHHAPRPDRRTRRRPARPVGPGDQRGRHRHPRRRRTHRLLRLPHRRAHPRRGDRTGRPVGRGTDRPWPGTPPPPAPAD